MNTRFRLFGNTVNRLTYLRYRYAFSKEFGKEEKEIKIKLKQKENDKHFKEYLKEGNLHKASRFFDNSEEHNALLNKALSQDSSRLAYLEYIREKIPNYYMENRFFLLLIFLYLLYHYKLHSVLEELKDPVKLLNSLTVDELERKALEKEDITVAVGLKERFTDVIGQEGVKEEFKELVDMVKYPEKYRKAGAKGVKGVLMVGPPGTGKTLMARALAGETEVKFIFCNGSDFDKPLYGQGEKKIKALFSFAKLNAPVIIFIDEIDSLISSRRRGARAQSGESSLINVFLAEMDGFERLSEVYLVGSTNDDKNLDKAALRPGRFDKVVTVGLPDKEDRAKMFDFYLNKLTFPLDEDLDSDSLAKMTPGFSGAEIESMVNSAALMAVDENKTVLNRTALEEARDRTIVGIKKNKRQTEKKRMERVAFEAGKAFVCLKNKLCSNTLHKISILPRGTQESYSVRLDAEEEYSKKKLEALLDYHVAGSVALKNFYGEDGVTVAAAEDLARANNIASRMVKEFVMSPEVYGHMTVEEGKEVSHKISENTRQKVDKAVQTLLAESEARTSRILAEDSAKLKELMQTLEAKEELTKAEIAKIIING